MNQTDTVTLLNRLILVSKDGEHALRAAADEAYHYELKDSLQDYSDFLHHTAMELQDAVRKVGGEPREIGSFENTLHRTWLHIKALASGRDESVILDSVEEDEATADRLFADAATRDMPPELHALIGRQAAEVQRRHQAIRELRERLLLH
jgi:uncharacterized protein (TIGR02284 family)